MSKPKWKCKPAPPPDDMASRVERAIERWEAWRDKTFPTDAGYVRMGARAALLLAADAGLDAEGLREVARRVGGD